MHVEHLQPAADAPSQNAETLHQWLQRQGTEDKLCGVIEALTHAAAGITDAIRFAPARGHTGGADNVNVQGEDQKMLDVITHELCVDALKACPDVKVMVSEEVEDVIPISNRGENARFAVCFDPLDGSSNIETNSAIGTIFSVLELEESTGEVTAEDVLAATDRQVAAGYFLYGPASLLVITTGSAVAMFGEDPETGDFFLARDNIAIPASTSEFAINVAHQRHWEPPVLQYIDECLAGETGRRGKQFNMRWAGSMVADVHRIFIRGGIFIYPALRTPGGAEGKLRFLYEALPMSMLVNIAGGAAISKDCYISDIRPSSLHQRVPLAMGSREEVEYLLKLSQTFKG